MHMRNEIVIEAPAQRIFEYASATDRWPEILPHYRYVRVLSADGKRRVVEMAATRPFKAGMKFPVRWRAEQIDDPDVPLIFFRHLGGWTNGMRVFWRFTSAGEGKTRVQIDHELQSPLAPFIGKYFVDPIATRTLQCMKRICEAA